MSHQGQWQLSCVRLEIHMGGRDCPETALYGLRYGCVIGATIGWMHKFALSCLEVDWGMMRRDIFDVGVLGTVICKDSEYPPHIVRNHVLCLWGYQYDNWSQMRKLQCYHKPTAI
jgi:hypothetical protein